MEFLSEIGLCNPPEKSNNTTLTRKEEQIITNQRTKDTRVSIENNLQQQGVVIDTTVLGTFIVN